MQYCFARAYAEQMGCEFQCEPWIGQRIFELSDAPISRELPRRSELDIKDGETDFNFRGYAQNQRCMIYTKKKVQDWFKIRPHIAKNLEDCRWKDDYILAHRRVGDYIGYGYVQVSKQSYYKACRNLECLPSALRFVSDEHPSHCDGVEREFDFLLDFYRLTKAKILLRGNSTFSWFAALLGNAEVYSPVIEGLEGGKEHDCEFVKGNHPRFANLDFVTDLHVKE